MADWDEELGNVGRFAVGAGVVLIGIAALTGKCDRDGAKTNIINYNRNRPTQELPIENNYNGQTTINNTYIDGNNNNVRQNINVNSNVRSNNTTGSSNTTGSTNGGSKGISTPQKKPTKSVPTASIDDTVENLPSANIEPEGQDLDGMYHAGYRNGNAYFENASGVQIEINPKRYNQVRMVNGAFIYGDYMLNSVPLEMRQIIFETNRSIDNQLRNDPFAPTVGRIRNVPESRGAFSSYYSGRAMNRMNATIMINAGRGTYMHPGWNYGYMGGPYLNGRH